jgi:DNA repair protein RadA/Sms
MTQGVDANRVALLIAVLERRLGMQLLGDDVFVNVAGGLELDEPALDLGLIAAVASSFKGRAIEDRVFVFGEVGLAGEVRAITQASTRLKEAVAMGFRRAIVPQSNLAGLPPLDDALELVGVRSVAEALEAIL